MLKAFCTEKRYDFFPILFVNEAGNSKVHDVILATELTMSLFSFL